MEHMTDQIIDPAHKKGRLSSADLVEMVRPDVPYAVSNASWVNMKRTISRILVMLGPLSELPYLES